MAFATDRNSRIASNDSRRFGTMGGCSGVSFGGGFVVELAASVFGVLVGTAVFVGTAVCDETVASRGVLGEPTRGETGTLCGVDSLGPDGI